jgi:AcrR family transcriptional regulator
MQRDREKSKSGELPNDKDRRAILVAGEALISEKGFGRTTVEDVATQAKVSNDVFYAHFQGMGALLRALSTHFTDSMLMAIDQSTKSGIWRGAAARDVIEVAVRTIIDVVLERQGLVRAFLAHGTTDPSLANDLCRVGTHMAKRIVGTLAECTNVPARPSRAVAFSILMAASLAHHHIMVGDEWAGVSFSKEQLTEEASRAICAYLGLEPTIAIRMNENAPDAAPTEMIPVVGTHEIEAYTPPSERESSG